jgi:DNA-binding NtrC family response regulator
MRTLFDIRSPIPHENLCKVAKPTVLGPILDPSKEVITINLFGKVNAFEKRLIIEALEQSKGNRAEAARILDIGRSTLNYKILKHGINIKREANVTD